jgi:hypothetical protein
MRIPIFTVCALINGACTADEQWQVYRIESHPLHWAPVPSSAKPDAHSWLNQHGEAPSKGVVELNESLAWAISGDGVSISNQDAIELLTIAKSNLKAPHAKNDKRPAFFPGIAFMSADRKERGIVCFKSNTWELVGIRSDSDFTPVRPRLVALMKRLFPNDPEMQALQ